MAEGDRSTPDPSPDPRPGPVWRAAGFVLAVLGIVLVAITPNPPLSVGDWVNVIGGAALTAFLTTYAGWHELVRRRLREPSRSAWRWMKKKRVAVGAAVLLTAALVVGVPPAWEFARGVSIDVAGCAPATQLRMVASRETAITAGELAGAYERWTAAENHDCPAVDVYVYAADADEIGAAIRSTEGWSDGSGALLEIGPRPDVWLAASSHETEGIAGATPIATSPVVLAVPEGEAGRAPGATGTWAEVFGAFAGGGPGVVRAGPEGSEVGLLATALLYGLGGREATGPQAPADVEQRLAAALDAGFPPGDIGELLCRHALLRSRAAVVASEQDVIRFNLGTPYGGPCLPDADSPDFVALYPSDTRGLDHQFVSLDWSGAPQAQAVAQFRAWLGGEPGRQAIVGSGLRPLTAFTVAPTLTTPGVDATVRVPVAPLPPSALQAARDVHEQAQRRGRVLFAVDTSGSMATVGPEGTRSDVAAAAVPAALERMQAGDEFGLWLFPDAAGTGRVEAVPLGDSRDERVGAARRRLDEAVPAGNTPLFRTMVDAAAALRARPAAGLTDAVVVLTDGEDTSSDVDAAAVAEALRGSRVRLIVVTIGEVRCADPGLTAVTTASAGTCIDADLADLDTAMAEATEDLWGGEG